jgi:dipeptidyl aminopeptidase/acylaminoacyl peptidase
MTPIDRFERHLPAALADLAEPRTPDYFTDILGLTARARQRPAWTSIERWLAMDLATQRVPTPSLPWRQLGVLALIAVLIPASLAVYVGTRPPLPEPFGPAGNGLVAYAVAGDIYTADPATGVVTPLVTGPTIDMRPQFSRDGSMLAFERRAGAYESDVYVIGADGSGLTRVTTEAVHLPPRVRGVPPEDFEFSPDGRSLLIPTGGRLLVADLEGSGIREVSLGMLGASGVVARESSFRPPDGSEILFVGTDNIAANGGAGLYAADPVAGTVRPIVEPSTANEILLASWSPDGSRIAYTAWNPTVHEFSAQVHIVAADGSDDRVVRMPAGAVWQGASFWSNDGSRLLIMRGMSDGYGSTKGVIVQSDGSGTGVEVDYDGVINGECCATWIWAPDDSAIIGAPLDLSGRQTGQLIIDPVTGRAGPTRWISSDDPTWQRIAP